MKLLLAEDDRIVRITVRDALEEAGYRVTECADGASALRVVESESFDVALTDVRLPELDGVSLFRRIRQVQPGTAVVLMTAYADTNDAVAVMREGARDYIVKPFEIDELLLRIGRVRHEVASRRQMEAGAPAVGAHRITGSSPAARLLRERLSAAAASDANVLFTGETGSGKDLCALTIYELGRRSGKPFVVVNCAAIPENLLESELFGHERGAFTSADRRRVGRFEMAHGGTLFFDEIGELPPGSQAKLLRAIETTTFEPLGTNRSVKVDVRIISATNRDIGVEVERGAFRKDLFFRLNVVDIAVPPLRDRRGDIQLLVEEFLAEICARQRRPAPVFDPCVVATLASYDYPGNVRELIHALERAVVMAASEGIVRLDHLPPAFAVACDCTRDRATAAADGVEPLGREVKRFERQYIRRVLAQAGGRRGRTAALLGISRKSLWQRLRENPE